MSILQGINIGQTASAGYKGMLGGARTPTGPAGQSYAPSGNARFDELQGEYALSTTEQRWDQALSIGESDGVQNAAIGASVLLPAAWAGGTALAGGATLGGATLAAGAAAAPLAVAAGVGFVSGMAGSWAGDKIGHGFMQSEFMRNRGYVPIAEDGEMPARLGHDIAHANAGLGLAGILGGIVLGAVAAVAVGALVAATGGAGLLLVAAAGAAAGGLVGGAGFGFASAVGQYGTNKGKIAEGSPNVFFENQPVARVGDMVACEKHAVSAVAEGAETVFANDLPIARIGHKTTCNGTINDGIDSIAIDIDTSALSLPINVGWMDRTVRSALVLTDILPFFGTRKRPRPGNQSATTKGNKPASVCTTKGCPVDVATGQFFEVRTDLHIPGTIPLVLERVHAPDSFGIQGKGWAGTWAQHLRMEGEVITWQDPEGVLITFHAPGDDVLSHNLRFPHIELLGRRGGDLFIYNRQTRLFHVFADEGGAIRRLARIEDRNGNRISLLYGADGLYRVEHSDGFALKVHSKDGLIRHAELDAGDADDCVFSWDYNRAGQLTAVKSSQTGQISYGYDAQGRIIGWWDAKDTRVHYAWGPENRIIHTWSDSGHVDVRLDYGLANQRTTTRTNGTEVQIWDWNDDGLVWRETDALGHVWLTEWDRAFHVTAKVDPLGNRHEVDFDEFGNPTRMTDADGNVSVWEYDLDGQLVATTDPAGNRTEYRHDENGNLVGMTDALGRSSSIGLGDRGQVLRIDLPGGVQQRIHYDPLLRPSRQIDADGGEIRMGFDTEGRLRWVTDQIGATTRHDMTRGPDNPRGAVRRVEQPDGSTSVLGWDVEGQLASITDPSGNTRHFRHGAFDLPVETVDAKGHRLRLEHDHEFRLSAVINEAGQRYELHYDPTGRLVAERDYSGLTTRYERDAAGRVSARIAPDGVRTEYDYSAAGLLLRMVVITPHGASETHYEYDARGLMIRARNDVAVVEYDHDALGRITAERLNGREITSDYSISGQRVARAGDVLHLTESWTRAGLPADLRIGDHAPLSFRHDARGLEQLRHSDAGFALAQGHTLMGQLAEQIAGPFARLPAEARAGTLGQTRPVELATRIGALAHRSYDWDRMGRAIAVNDRIAGHVQLGYDQRGQVTGTRRELPDGQVVLSQFEYDPTRNLAAVIEAGQSQPVEIHFGRVKRRGHVSYRHDACGRVIEKRVEEPGFRPRIWQMAWDGQDQLASVRTPEGTVWHYAYDPFGRRIARVSGENGYAYQWEGDQLIAEAPMTANGSIAWDDARHWVYEPGSFRPLAQVEGGRVHYIVTDHLGTPRELLSEDGEAVAWRVGLSLWGEVHDHAPRPAANDDHAPTSCPIRFQGQWEDAETGLYYNRFRYYDPDATQYLSPDPIGLEGGVRHQAYVADPNSWIDPLGLAGCPRDTARFRRWKRGDAIDKPLPDGSAPSWDTVRTRYWKNRAHMADPSEFSRANMRRMQRGRAPQDYNPRTGKFESRELHHVIPQRHGGANTPLNLRELTPDQHGEVDPFRHTTPTIRGIL